MSTSLPIVDASPEHHPGALETKLAQLWPRARARVDTLAFWRETVRLRRRFSLRTLRLKDVKVMVPKLQTPNCEDCTDICCTGSNAIVSLRLRDIAALVDAGLEQHIVARAGEAQPAAKTWARREADGSIFHDVFPVLARDPTGTCMLLDDERRCGAYPAWPLSCARYPYALDLQSKVVFYAKSCQSTHAVPAVDAPIRVRTLLHAVLAAYNERVRDAVYLYMARPELE
ncbi:MAG TPA: YkgJ family cysteine cluster protein, partial [Myxococcota bacterium]